MFSEQRGSGEKSPPFYRFPSLSLDSGGIGPLRGPRAAAFFSKKKKRGGAQRQRSERPGALEVPRSPLRRGEMEKSFSISPRRARGAGRSRRLQRRPENNTPEPES
jgi:hypothetical protein